MAVATKIPVNLLRAVKVQVQDLVDSTRGRLFPVVHGLDGWRAKCLADLQRDGFAIVEGYWDRDRALRMRDELEPYIAEGEDREFENGAYVRCRSSDKQYDSGVRRIYHVDRLNSGLAEFRNDRAVLDVVSAYYGVRFYSGTLMFQHNIADRGTRYYHVDSFGKQAKSFLYLDDVDQSNGPFTFIRGSHRNKLRRFKKHVLGNKEDSDTTFFDSDIGPMINQEVQLVGKAGTLIVADVRGLHRGSPQKDRTRSIVVNYLYPNAAELDLDK